MIDIWVDGSFVNGKPCWAMLVKENEITIHQESGVIDDPKAAKYHQVVGEIQAAMNALTWCLQNKVTSVNLHYDYTGIQYWAIDAWAANNSFTKAYKQFMQVAMKTVSINWTKVKAHSGDANNNAVDSLAKTANAPTIEEVEINKLLLIHRNKKYEIDLNLLTVVKYE